MRETLHSAEKDKLIARRFLASPYARYGSFFIYLSFGSEVDTQSLVAALLREGKTVCVPVIADGDMKSVPYTRALTRNAFGILQPESGNELTCEVALTPLLAADGATRLGYGGGYYDRYFARYPNVIRVGLMYEGQAAPYLPRESCDIPLDAVVSECGINVYGRS